MKSSDHNFFEILVVVSFAITLLLDFQLSVESYFKQTR